MLRTILTIVQVFSCLGIVGLVLLQRGKGADAGAGFGSGASGTVFGARGATTGLSRATAVLAAIFMLNSLAMAYTSSHRAAEQQKTILDAVSTPAPPTSPPVSAPLPAGGGSSPSPASNN